MVPQNALFAPDTVRCLPSPAARTFREKGRSTMPEPVREMSPSATRVTFPVTPEVASSIFPVAQYTPSTSCLLALVPPAHHGPLESSLRLPVTVMVQVNPARVYLAGGAAGGTCSESGRYQTCLRAGGLPQT